MNISDIIYYYKKFALFKQMHNKIFVNLSCSESPISFYLWEFNMMQHEAALQQTSSTVKNTKNAKTAC